LTELLADTATALALGRRERQEDAVVAEFPQGGGPGFAVLSDGMGGHGAGDVASKIIVAEMFGALLFACACPQHVREAGTEILAAAAEAANDRLRRHAETQGAEEVMGGTLVSTIVAGGGLRWISVGDSPLYLYREGALRRLNENHSMAARIDQLVRGGMMDAETARDHPQRHCLTSALTGAGIDRIDCPDGALPLRPGDVVLMASDGVHALSDPQIRQVLDRHRRADSRTIADALRAAVLAAEAPHQDNLSLIVIRMEAAAGARRAAGPLAGVGHEIAEAGRRLLAPMRAAGRKQTS